MHHHTSMMLSNVIQTKSIVVSYFLIYIIMTFFDTTLSIMQTVYQHRSSACFDRPFSHQCYLIQTLQCNKTISPIHLCRSLSLHLQGVSSSVMAWHGRSSGASLWVPSDTLARGRKPWSWPSVRNAATSCRRWRDRKVHIVPRNRHSSSLYHLLMLFKWLYIKRLLNVTMVLW